MGTQSIFPNYFGHSYIAFMIYLMIVRILIWRIKVQIDWELPVLRRVAAAPFGLIIFVFKQKIGNIDCVPIFPIFLDFWAAEL